MKTKTISILIAVDDTIHANFDLQDFYPDGVFNPTKPLPWSCLADELKLELEIIQRKINDNEL